MMKITEEIIESLDDISKLIDRDGRPRLVFYEVYKGIPCEEMEAAIGELGSDEVFYRINLDHHSPNAYGFHCREPEFLCTRLGIPVGTHNEIPLIASFVTGVGFYTSVNSISEVPELLKNSRKEKEDIRVALEKYRQSKSKNNPPN